MEVLTGLVGKIISSVLGIITIVVAVFRGWLKGFFKELLPPPQRTWLAIANTFKSRSPLPEQSCGAVCGNGNTRAGAGEGPERRHREDHRPARRQCGRIGALRLPAYGVLTSPFSVLGEREPGTGHLEQAVVAFTEALKERTRDRVPLDWAARRRTNLGVALAALGERESGTEHLEQAVVAFTEALEEQTRDRVPLDWATSATPFRSCVTGARRYWAHSRDSRKRRTSIPCVTCSYRK